VIALPGLIASAVIVPFWLAELVLRLVFAPLATVLRLTCVVPYRLELYRKGEPRGTYTATGRGELVRLRRELKHTQVAKAGRSQSHPSKAWIGEPPRPPASPWWPRRPTRTSGRTPTS
jgi:hypothetical protein